MAVMRVMKFATLFLFAFVVSESPLGDSSEFSLSADGRTLIPQDPEAALASGLSFGIDPELQTNLNTDLLMAAMSGSSEEFHEALTQGAELGCVDTFGRNALSLAAINGREALVEEILRFPVSWTDKTGRSIREQVLERMEEEVNDIESFQNILAILQD